MICLPFDAIFLENKSPDKAKPFERRGRKAAGLLRKDGRAAEGWTSGKLGFFIHYYRGNRMKDQNKTKKQLIDELSELRQQIDKLEALESEHKMIEGRLDRRAKELASLQATVLDITAPHDLPTLLQTIVERAVSLLYTKGGGLYLCDPDRREVRCVVSYNTPHDYRGTVLKYGEGAAGTVGQTGEPLVIDDYRTWSKRAVVYEKDQPFSAVLSAPMIWHGNVTGVIHVLHDVESRRFTQADLALLTLFANHAAIAVENTRLYQEALKEITERKLAEEKLRESEKKYRVLVEESLQGLVIGQGVPPRLVFVNPAMTKILGYTADELTTLSTKEIEGLLHPQDRTIFFKNYKDRLEGKSAPPRYEVRGIRKDGAGVWLELSGTRIEYKGQPAVQATFVDITERKKAEEALQESEEKYRSILENIAEGYYEVDLAGNFTFFNDSVCRMMGYPREELMGMNNRQYMDQENAKKLYQTFNKVYKTGKPTEEFGWEIIRKDGAKRFVGASVSLIKDSRGQPTGFRGIVRDITERKRAEEELLKSEEKYRFITDRINDVVWILDTKLRPTYVSPSVLKVLGFTPEERLGQTLRDRVTPASAEKVQEILKHELQRDRERGVDPDRSLTLELEYYHKDGSIVWVEQVVGFIRDGEGNVVGIHGVSRNINERKRAEEALRESEARYRLLAENANDVIWTIDMDLNITYISPSVKQARGYTVEEAMAQTLPEIYTPESLAVAIHAFEEELAIESREEKDLNRSRTLELEYKCKDGSTIWSEVKLSFFRDSSGRAIGILGVGRNITERKKAEKEKAELQQQLQQSQKMEAIGRLAGGIAHDFNNLLTVIKGYCDLALMGLREEGPLRRAIDEINKAGDRAATLTHQLLAFSRRQILELKIVDLNDILRNLNKMLRRLIGEDIELVTILGEDLGKVRVDPGQMEQVVMNLAVNARDAMPMGGRLILETSNVEVGEEYARSHVDLKVGSYVMLSIRDTGIGIAPEVREYIFEPFFTTKERGKGTGLGLSMVYGIVHQSGGFIGVESELGRGTTFKIYFPRVVERVEGLEARPVKQEMPRGSETVLVVEDDGAVRNLASQILKKQGYRVLEASSGEEALGLYGVMKEPIHLVLTDVVMPQMSGRELADHLISFHPKMKILYMSGYTDDAIVQHGVLEEGVSYIQKPFTMEGLAKRVREVLNKELS